MRFMKGYIETTDKEDAPKRMLNVPKIHVQYLLVNEFLSGLKLTNLYQFNCTSTPSPADSWSPRKATACVGVMSPRARGRSFVRSS